MYYQHMQGQAHDLTVTAIPSVSHQRKNGVPHSLHRFGLRSDVDLLQRHKQAYPACHNSSALYSISRSDDTRHLPLHDGHHNKRSSSQHSLHLCSMPCPCKSLKVRLLLHYEDSVGLSYYTHMSRCSPGLAMKHIPAARCCSALRDV